METKFQKIVKEMVSKRIIASLQERIDDLPNEKTFRAECRKVSCKHAEFFDFTYANCTDCILEVIGFETAIAKENG